MPKRKSLTKITYLATQDAPTKELSSVARGRVKYSVRTNWDAEKAAALANKSYAHGYRNGMRAGRKG